MSAAAGFGRLVGVYPGIEMNGVRYMNIPAGRGDGVAALFEAVVTHAGTTQLADDATAVLVRW